MFTTKTNSKRKWIKNSVFASNFIKIYSVPYTSKIQSLIFQIQVKFVLGLITVFLPKNLVHYELDFSLLGPCFDDPNDQKLASGVVNLPSKFQRNPTVN
jgi:hypothetical protein